MWIEVFLAVALLFLLNKWIYSYWSRRGIPQLDPQFPFGNTLPTFRQRRAYAELTGDLYRQAIQREHRFIGIYILFQPVLLITDAELTKRILTVDFDHFADRGTHVNERRDPLSAHLFSLAGAKWKSMRQKLTPAFTTAKLRGMFPTMMDCGRTLSKVLDRQLGQLVHFRDLMARFTMDVVASVGFGVECNSLENPDVEFRRLGIKFFAKGWKTSLRMFLGFVAPNINRFLQVKLVEQDVEDYMLKMVRNTIAMRETGGVVRRDFIQMLVQLRNQGALTDRWDMDKVVQKKSLTVEQIAAQSFVFLNAGYETSSSTINFCLFELCRNRDHLTRVVEEIDRVLDGDEISYDSIAQMTFLDACIDETLRKYPILPILFRICTKDYKIPDTDVVVKEGTLVHIPLFGLQYDERYFEDPLQFNPERFFERSGDSLPSYPFGDGQRVCIGKRMGKVMAKMALAEMLSKYDFVLDPSVPDGEIVLDPSLLFLKPKNDILFTPTRRDANA